MSNDDIIEQAIEQIKEDLAHGDTSAIAELLERVPLEFLKGFIADD